jgi:hypothetical protein
MVDCDELEDCTLNNNVQSHIQALQHFAKHAVIAEADVDGLEYQTTRLRVIQRAIGEFETNRQPVPMGLRGEKRRVEAKIKQLIKGSEIVQVYEALKPIVEGLKQKCQPLLAKGGREKDGSPDRRPTPPEAFRESIRQFLEESDGSAELSNVLKRIRQRFRGHFKAADLDPVRGKQGCRWEENVRQEIREMKNEHILLNRGGSTLTLAGRIDGLKQPGSQRLRWNRASRRRDCFDLRLVNPEVLDVPRCRQLLEDIRTNDDVDPSYISEFQKWLDHPDTPLGERTYARLTDWFLTDERDSQSGPLAEAARELWKVLYCQTPDRPLADAKRGHKILPKRLGSWWSKQWDHQGM